MMRLSVRALILAVVLALPRIAAAGELQLTVGEPFLDFGPAGATFGSTGFPDLFIDGVFQETPWFSNFSGDVTFEAGPVVSLTIDDSDPDITTSRYVFSPGTLTLTARWSDPFGAPVEGLYVAPLLNLVIDIRCEQELSAVDCGDPFGGSLGDASASFGPGVFDASLAGALGLTPAGGAFTLDWPIDGITGSPSDALRLAGSGAGSADLAVPVTVPEPSVLSLLLLAAALRLRRTS
jgi:hypothetical protein